MMQSMNRDASIVQEQAATGNFRLTVVEGLILFSTNQDLRTKLTSALRPPKFKWNGSTLEPRADAASLNVDLEKVLQAGPTTLFLDCAYPELEAEAFLALAADRPLDLRKKIEAAGNLIPGSIRFLKAIHQIRRTLKLKDLLVFFVIGRTSTAISHALLSAGADWLWSPQEDAGKIPDIISSLRAIHSEALPSQASAGNAHGRVFVAENSRNVCKALRIRLERHFDLRFAGEEKPGNRFELSPEEAVQAFDQGVKESGYLAAIVDLALSNSSEEEAKQRFASDENTVQTFSKQDWQVIGDIFGGVEVIKQIRQRAPQLRIFVFSNYIHVRNVNAMINRLVGRDIWSSHVVTIGKNEKGYRQIREELFALAADSKSAFIPQGVQ